MADRRRAGPETADRRRLDAGADDPAGECGAAGQAAARSDPAGAKPRRTANPARAPGRPQTPPRRAPAQNRRARPRRRLARSCPQAQLSQLVAPIALYPDPLLSQILMASTYPLEVVEAARWVDAPDNKALKGDALLNAAKAQNWDPSVTALVPFPRVLQTMSTDISWTQNLGNAFLAQQADVMAAVQQLRHEAMAAGNLKQTPQCGCTIKTSGEYISIEPVPAEQIVMPVYSPTVAYGEWLYPGYPPFAFPPPVGFAFAPGLAIGWYPPIYLAAAFDPWWNWGWFNWGGGFIAVDPGRFAVIGGGRLAASGGVWVHDPAHRGGVAYANAGGRGPLQRRPDGGDECRGDAVPRQVAPQPGRPVRGRPEARVLARPSRMARAQRCTPEPPPPISTLRMRRPRSMVAARSTGAAHSTAERPSTAAARSMAARSTPPRRISAGMRRRRRVPRRMAVAAAIPVAAAIITADWRGAAGFSRCMPGGDALRTGDLRLRRGAHRQ